MEVAVAGFTVVGTELRINLLSAPDINETVTGDRAILSVVSVAVRVREPESADFIVKVATPLALLVLVPVGGANVSVAPRLDERATIFPETGVLVASFKVTVIAIVAVPSATTESGETENVLFPATGGPPE